MKSLLKLVGLAVLALVAVIVGRTVMNAPEDIARDATYNVDLDMDRIAQNLATATSFKTISPQPPLPLDPVPFDGFIDWLAATYPEFHAATTLTKIADYSLLFEWKGKDSSQKPILLEAHYDVVPVIPGTENDWNHPPYGGVIKDGVIYGRGTLDDKGSLVAMLEAATHLIKQGYAPDRSIYFAFGHDEEIGGNDGAAGIVKKLRSDGVQLAWSLGEGSMVLDGIMPGIKAPVASINLTEKGYMTVELVARAEGGHSSMPPKETAVGILSEAIVKLQENPVPGGLDGASAGLFNALAPHFGFVERMLFSNQWLFGGVLDTVLSSAKTTNAMLRTTTAPTMLSGSIKENVLPIEAVGTINFRLHPRDTVDGVMAYIKDVVNDDRIEVRLLGGRGAAPVASADTEAYRILAEGFEKVFGEVIIVAGMTIAGTDSKHYAEIADNVYRILPFTITNEDLAGFHGTNERLSVENLRKGTVYYIYLLETAGKR